MCSILAGGVDTVSPFRDWHSNGLCFVLRLLSQTVTAIMSFVLAMLKNPEAQKLAQLEIDRVVGTDRLPTFGDEADLPYVQALCAEVLR